MTVSELLDHLRDMPPEAQVVLRNSFVDDDIWIHEAEWVGLGVWHGKAVVMIDLEGPI